jgi:DNA-directed RNA polymerase subunit RPC12/RpoP
MLKHEEIKKQQLANYEKFLDKMLSNLPEPESLTLSDLERATGEVGSEMMQDLLQNLASEAQIESEKQIMCPDCGSKSYRRGKRTKQVISSRGEIELERQYYVCSQCGHGFFPPRPEMGTE